DQTGAEPTTVAAPEASAHSSELPAIKAVWVSGAAAFLTSHSTPTGSILRRTFSLEARSRATAEPASWPLKWRDSLPMKNLIFFTLAARSPGDFGTGTGAARRGRGTGTVFGLGRSAPSARPSAS